MALRLMTFNVQILPLIAQLLHFKDANPEERARTAADAIRALPMGEWPHVIAFNEVFSEDGRDVLIDQLPEWRYRVRKIHDGGLEEDSGLLLLSRLPLLALATGGTWHERIYSSAAGDDARASKAVGVVQVHTPVRPTTIAFTHLQAAYASEDEYAAERADQLQTILEAVGAVVGTHDPARWRNVVVVGDLNVRGDSGAVSGEWAETFALPGAPFGSAFNDGWRSYMHAPATDEDRDRGVTSIDLATGERRRLDYQCFSNPGIPAREVVPHHMFVRLRDQSDHFALEAVIDAWSPHCSPSDAIVLSDLSPVSGTATDAFVVDVRFDTTESYQWVYLDQPGTYSVFRPPGLRARLFLESDLSRAVAPKATLSASDLPGDAPAAVEKLGLDPEGTTVLTREPCLIAVQTTAVDPHADALLVFRHRGATPQTALWLQPHVELDPELPAGQPLGTDDRCWLRAAPAPTAAGLERDEHFAIDNGSGEELVLEALDTAMGPLAPPVAGAGSSLHLTLPCRGDQELLFCLTRASYDATDLRLRWTSPVSYLVLDEPLLLMIADESGWDPAGADEIRLKLFLDGTVVLFDGAWDDADTGERWPGFAEAVRAAAQAQVPGARRIGFTSDLAVEYHEEDFTAGAWRTEFLYPLTAGEPPTAARALTLPVADALGDGHYKLYCTLSRYAD